ncbi:hypothetical protein [Cellulosimicrobium protaetiae]|uniref:Uncharacterized protein n=1 Tax=Cellulosimicrobium protaetiae TaxID=2587808 RepID=A0A6M5UH24_9MICO|nr:hypothetical protein [Cellulosimicrobium protaetiae]QJW37886.1 hypothetical protein FIC82_018640 [Cellulosimicrobium protaetiae]
MSSEQSPVPDGAAPDTSDAPEAVAAPAAVAPGAADEATDEATDEVEVEDVVDPTTVRRAPRYGRFLAVGVVLGTVLGLGVGGAWLQSPVSVPVFKPGVYFTVIVVTFAALGAGVAGLWAVLADRRSVRGRR